MRPPGILPVVLVIAPALLLLVAFPHAARAAPAPATVEAHAIKWAELRAEAARLDSEWQWQRSVLQATQEALQLKLHALEAQRDEHRAAHAQAREEVARRAADNAVRHEALQSLDQRLRRLSEEILQTRHRLPPRLAAAIELPAQSLANPTLPLAERVQHLVTIESRCSHFNRVITYSEEVWPMPGEDQPRLLEILYWGMASAYALDRDRQRAWVGRPGPERWEWQLQPGLAEVVVQLLAIHRDEAQPAFVALPLHLDVAPPTAP
jgi:Skp family chaperone for outer membrane proteins